MDSTSKEIAAKTMRSKVRTYLHVDPPMDDVIQFVGVGESVESSGVQCDTSIPCVCE